MNLNLTCWYQMEYGFRFRAPQNIKITWFGRYTFPILVCVLSYLYIWLREKQAGSYDNYPASSVLLSLLLFFPRVC